MKKRSRREILSTWVLPFSSVAARKLERKSSPRNLAMTWPAESRKVKLPSLRLTRRTSGVKAGVEVSATVGSLGGVTATGEGGAVTTGLTSGAGRAGDAGSGGA